MEKKTVLLYGGIALVALLALVLIARARAASQAAQATDNGAGGFPTVLFTSGGGATSPALMSDAGNAGVAVGGSSQADQTTTGASAPATTLAAIAAALQANLQGAAASTVATLNGNADSLFSGLPKSLADAGLTGFSATQKQSTDGTTQLDVSSVYKSSAAPAVQKFIYYDPVYGPTPTESPDAERKLLTNDYLAQHGSLDPSGAAQINALVGRVYQVPAAQAA